MEIPSFPPCRVSTLERAFVSPGIQSRPAGATYLFNVEGRIPQSHLLRRINPTVTRMSAEFRERLEPFYSEIALGAVVDRNGLRRLAGPTRLPE
jgi:hypothetical protein